MQVRLNSSRTESCSKREFALAYLDWIYSSEDAQIFALKNGFVPLTNSSRNDVINHILANMRCQNNGILVATSNEYLLNSVQNLSLHNISLDSVDDVDGTYCQDVKMIGEMSVNFKTPNIPMTTISIDLFLDAAFVAVAILLEHISNLRRYAEQGEYDVNSKVDFLALGSTNVISSIFGSFACGAGFSRSAVNMGAGAKSQMSLLLSSFIVLGLAYSLRDILYFLPKPVLASIIFMAVCKLVDVKNMMRTWRESKWDFVTLFIAFVSTLCIGVTMGILLAVMSSLCVFIYYSSRPRIVELRRRLGTVSYRSAEERIYNAQSRVVKSEFAFVLRPETPLYFGNIDALLLRIDEECRKRFSLVCLGREKWLSLVLSFGCVGWIDSTAANALKKKIVAVRNRGLTVCLSECNERTMKRLRKCGVVASVGGHAFCFPSVHSAVMAMSLREDEKKDFLGIKVASSVASVATPSVCSKEDYENGSGDRGGDFELHDMGMELNDR